MPLKGWIHPVDRDKVPFGTFVTDRSMRGRPAANPWMARLAETQAREDIRHAGSDITATRVLGCPRQVYIETQMDYWVDPKKVELRVRGTAAHTEASKWFNPEVWYTEASEPVMLTIAGVWGGYKYTRKADVLRRDLSEIVDLKFPMDFQNSYRKTDAKLDHQAQLNLARLGLAQQQWALDEGYDPERVLLTIWDHCIGKNEFTKGCAIWEHIV